MFFLVVKRNKIAPIFPLNSVWPPFRVVKSFAVHLCSFTGWTDMIFTRHYAVVTDCANEKMRGRSHGEARHTQGRSHVDHVNNALKGRPSERYFEAGSEQGMDRVKRRPGPRCRKMRKRVQFAVRTTISSRRIQELGIKLSLNNFQSWRRVHFSHAS